MTPDTLADGALRWRPAAGRAEQLMLLLHGVGSQPQAMAPLAAVLRAEFPQAELVALAGFEPFDMAPPGAPGRQWFSVRGVDDGNRVERVAAVLPRLQQRVRQAQLAGGVGPAATALVGFSQGAIVSLELAAAHDGLAGRVLAFAGRYAALPAAAPRETTLHFFHGADDAVIPAALARQAIGHLAALQADATIDIASATGHELAPALMRCAIERLRTHIPHRTWMAALGAAPRGLRGADDDED